MKKGQTWSISKCDETWLESTWLYSHYMPLQWPGKHNRYSDWLRAGRYGDRIPVGTRFSSPVQTGPGAHPASCTMGTGSFPGVKSGRSVTLTPHPFYCRVHERVELYLYSPYGPYGLYRASVPVQGCTLPYLSACTRVHFTLSQCLYKGALYLTSVPAQGCTLPHLSACTRVHFTFTLHAFTTWLLGTGSIFSQYF